MRRCWDDLREVLKTGGSADLTIVVQYDGCEGAARYVVPPHAAPDWRRRKRSTGSTAGEPQALLDFLHWGMTVCPSDRLALVIGSPYSVSPGKGADSDSTNVLSLTYDQGSGNFLNVSELAGVLRQALTDADRERLDLVAIDSCYVQFLELAYELEDIVRVLIAPQTTIPVSGWNYASVLSRWKTLAAVRPSPGLQQVARALVDEIVACYGAGKDHAPASVSALDLERLDDLANAFDTLCIGSMQVLGEELIWTARDLLLNEMKETTSASVYDCGSFFALWSEALDTFADEAYQRWLATTLKKKSTGTKLDRFVDAVARHLEAEVEPRSGRSTEDTRAVNERLELVIGVLRAENRQRCRSGASSGDQRRSQGADQQPPAGHRP